MIGKLVRELRGLNISQRELAQKIGVSHSYISKLESSLDSHVTDEVIEKLARALECDKSVMYIACGRIPPDQFIIDENVGSIYGQIEQFIRSSYSKNNNSIDELEIFFNIFNQSKTIIFLVDQEKSELIYQNISASLYLRKLFPGQNSDQVWNKYKEYITHLCEYNESKSVVLDCSIRGNSSLVELNLDSIEIRNHQYLLIQIFEEYTIDRFNEFTLLNESHFHEVFDNSLNAIIVFKYVHGDSYGELIQANQSACELLGYSPEELTGLVGPHIFEPQTNTASMRLKKLNQYKRCHDISVFKTKDDQYVPVEVYSHLGSMGKNKFILLSCSDLSQVKNAHLQT